MNETTIFIYLTTSGQIIKPGLIECVFFSPTFHWCCEGPPGHQGSRPGCSLQGAGPRAGWSSLASQNSKLYPSA